MRLKRGRVGFGSQFGSTGPGSHGKESKSGCGPWGHEAVGQIAFTVRKQKEGPRPVLATLSYLVLPARDVDGSLLQYLL